MPVDQKYRRVQGLSPIALDQQCVIWGEQSDIDRNL